MDGSMNDKTSRFEGKSEAELLKMHTKGMAICEGVWREVSRRFEKAADNDRSGKDAMLEGKARMMQKKFEALHAEADVLATEFGGFPMAKSGDR